MVIKSNCPCKDCEKRYPACHDTCDAYTRYKLERARIQEAERQQANDIFAYIERVNRRKNK